MNGKDGKGPLQAYFLGEKMHEAGSTSGGLSASNMYLAEDRVLAFELVCKKNESWTMKYVKSAKVLNFPILFSPLLIYISFSG